jgi:exopolysaccharide biosynthesis polyprenyl glycosylphosphotransferase
MFSYRARGLAVMVAVLQGVLALGVCFGRHLWVVRGGVQPARVLWESGPWLVGIICAAFWYAMNARGGPKPGFREALARTLPVLLVAAAFRVDRLSAGVELLDSPRLGSFMLMALLLAVSHWGFPRLLSHVCFSSRHRHRAVVVGSALRVRELCGVLESGRPMGFEVVAWLREDDAVPVDTGLPFFGDADLLEEVVGEEKVSHVVLAESPPDSLLVQRLDQCEKWGVRLVVAQSLQSRWPGRFQWETHGFWRFGAAYAEPLQNPFNRFLKRAMDVGVCVLALFFAFLPVAALTWWTQRRQSPGPLFYRQWRHGRGNAPFEIWKFRTMHCGHQAAAKQAYRGDPRVYPFGAWLRRTSLDELPQFLNVLRGEMSVVGPRPHFVDHTESFARQKGYHVRSFVKPGVTGLAQVNGCRGEVRDARDMERRVEWDIRYLERWSLALDCWLILRTVAVVLKPPKTAC